MESVSKVTNLLFNNGVKSRILYKCVTALSFKIAHMFPKISLFYRRHTANMPAKNSTTDSMPSPVLNI